MANAQDRYAHLGIFLAGAAVGAVAGLLLAPGSGQETRRRIVQKYEDERRGLMQKGQRVVEETAQRLEHGIEDGKRRLTEALRA
jgi:gas vesicle protein